MSEIEKLFQRATNKLTEYQEILAVRDASIESLESKLATAEKERDELLNQKSTGIWLHATMAIEKQEAQATLYREALQELYDCNEANKAIIRNKFVDWDEAKKIIKQKG